jgi:uncharacterized membrane protein YdjX (TVP38/TMEM64 family)
MKRKKLYFNIAVLILLTALIVYFWQPLFLFFSNQEEATNFILSYGIWAPLVFIILQIIQIIFAPIPGQLVGALGGYIFGLSLGTIYSLAGLAIGSFLVFLISRKFGRPVIKHFIKTKNIKKFDKITSSKTSLFVIFLIFFLPFFPDDAVCFLIGLTKIPLSILVIIVILGRLPSIIVAVFLGSQIKTFSCFIFLIYFIIFIIITICFLIFKERIENFLLSRLKKE